MNNLNNTIYLLIVMCFSFLLCIMVEAMKVADISNALNKTQANQQIKVK